MLQKTQVNIERFNPADGGVVEICGGFGSGKKTTAVSLVKEFKSDAVLIVSGDKHPTFWRKMMPVLHVFMEDDVERFKTVVTDLVGAYRVSVIVDEGTEDVYRQCLLSLLDHKTGCTLSQTRVGEKTNEAKAALTLLHSLVLKGRVITADAMFCQREVCQTILQGGGHYLIVVKDNQPALREALTAEFQAAFSPDERTGAPSATAMR